MATKPPKSELTESTAGRLAFALATSGILKSEACEIQAMVVEALAEADKRIDALTAVLHERARELTDDALDLAISTALREHGYRQRLDALRDVAAILPHLLETKGMSAENAKAAADIIATLDNQIDMKRCLKCHAVMDPDDIMCDEGNDTFPGDHTGLCTTCWLEREEALVRRRFVQQPPQAREGA